MTPPTGPHYYTSEPPSRGSRAFAAVVLGTAALLCVAVLAGALARRPVGLGWVWRWPINS